MKSPTWCIVKEYTSTIQRSTSVDFIPTSLAKCPVLLTRNKAYNALSSTSRDFWLIECKYTKKIKGTDYLEKKNV